MLVTLDIFSGRPNPTWNLPEREQRQLIDRVKGRRMARAELHEASLGYRGLVIQTTEEAGGELPPSFRLGGFGQLGDAVGTAQPLSAVEDDEVVRFLLATARAAMSDDLQQMVADERLRQGAPPNVGIDPPIPPEPPEPGVCQLVPTTFQPGVWNYVPVIYQNNCYNYAMSRLTNTFAQPGRASGQMATAMNCTDVGAAADRDGCKTTCKGPSKKVALVIWPGWDYHWYRKSAEGFWGHKPGGTAARNTDSLNRVINGTTLTPANCARGPYTVFCGYRYAPKTIVIS